MIEIIEFKYGSLFPLAWYQESDILFAFSKQKLDRLIFQDESTFKQRYYINCPIFEKVINNGDAQKAFSLGFYWEMRFSCDFFEIEFRT